MSSTVITADPQEILQRVQAARAKVEEKTQQRAGLQARQQQFTEELERFKEQLRQRGIEPSELDVAIDRAEQKMLARLLELEGKLDGISPTAS